MTEAELGRIRRRLHSSRSPIVSAEACSAVRVARGGATATPWAEMDGRPERSHPLPEAFGGALGVGLPICDGTGHVGAISGCPPTRWPLGDRLCLWPCRGSSTPSPRALCEHQVSIIILFSSENAKHVVVDDILRGHAVYHYLTAFARTTDTTWVSSPVTNHDAGPFLRRVSIVDLLDLVTVVLKRVI